MVERGTEDVVGFARTAPVGHAAPSDGRATAAEPLVLIHGLGSNRRAWDPLLPALERPHAVLALDLPGFGEAPPLPPGATPTVPALADAVERAMEAAGLETAHLAGNSMGGWIALELARRGRARTVIAISPAGLGTPRENAFAKRSLKLARALARLAAPVAHLLLRPAAIRRALQWQFFARPQHQTADEAAYAVRALARAPAFPAACDWLFDHRADGLEEIRCPVLIAWGTKDRLLLPLQGPRFVRRVPGARLQRLEGLGHIPMPDDPAVVAHTILALTTAAGATITPTSDEKGVPG
jgi:pimeloyl-ACP methyl ester carboxylesterase